MKDSVFFVVAIYVAFLLLKDFFSILGYFFNVDYFSYFLVLNYILLPCAFIFLNKTIKVTKPFFIILLLVFLDFFVLFINSAYWTNSSVYDVVVFFIFYMYNPAIVVLIAGSSPMRYFKSLVSVWKFIFYLSVFFGIVQLYFLSVSPDASFEFYKGLHEEGVISFPLQTSSQGVELRLSSIFYSSFAFGGFLTVSVCFILYGYLSSNKIYNLIFLIVSFYLLYLTYNRNSMLACLFVVFFYFFSEFWVGSSRQRSVFCGKIIAFSGVFFLMFSLIFPVYFAVSGFEVSTPDASSISKLSTFESRVNTWSYILYDRSEDLIFGTGYVQGLIDPANVGFDVLMIDNLFFAKLFQSGFVGVSLVFFIVLYLIFWSMKSLKGIFYKENMAFILIFSSSILIFSVNTYFYDPLFLVFCLGGMICSTRINFNAKREFTG